MKFKIFYFLVIMILIISCNEYSREKYPKNIIMHLEPWKYEYVESCSGSRIKNFKIIPRRIRSKINSYFKKRIGIENFNKLSFESALVFSDTIKKNTSRENDLDSLFFGFSPPEEPKEEDCILNNNNNYHYPVYNTSFSLSLPKIGIKELGLNLTIDNNGRVIKDIEFPKFDKQTINIIPIDSVHTMLIEMQIPYKRIDIELKYSRMEDSFFWYTKTIVNVGSFAGPSCLPEYKYHFKMNAGTGEITKYEDSKANEYFEN